MSEPPRWHLRLDQFAAAVAGVAEAVDRLVQVPGDELIMAGTVQRFENAWEMGWKLMRDFLRWGGNPVEVAIAINVIRAAMQVNLIDDGDVWVRAMKDRNVMSHVYDAKQFRDIATRVGSEYLAVFQRLLACMEAQRDGGG